MLTKRKKEGKEGRKEGRKRKSESDGAPGND
jgi:hypothetical protein